MVSASVLEASVSCTAEFASTSTSVWRPRKCVVKTPSAATPWEATNAGVRRNSAETLIETAASESTPVANRTVNAPYTKPATPSPGVVTTHAESNLADRTPFARPRITGPFVAVHPGTPATRLAIVCRYWNVDVTTNVPEIWFVCRQTSAVALRPSNGLAIIVFSLAATAPLPTLVHPTKTASTLVQKLGSAFAPEATNC